ncbi:MAG: Carbonic anhydrase precursor [Candidatus Methanofastidiosum methylothiophilum]|uniref:Carbonic anhydrase n=1 Tax=Candidatus Methanofastidiosum methylothiophilum TaxID=1705564 RepID=A0A150IVS6_9EURY|nr:MAG: Carbonic anhydrase precursor [Candidatus Methanofastidiosum methylthiophilus]
MINDELEVHPEAFVHEKAFINGKVRIGKNSSIWPFAVLRGDIEKIEIGEGSNVQDNAVVHTDSGKPTIIGNNVVVGHCAVVHGAVVGNNVLIGINATVLSGSRIGNNCIIGAGAVVNENMEIADNSIAVGVPAMVIKRTDEKAVERIKKNAESYIELSKKYRK